MRDKALQLYLLGFPIRRIAETLGVSASTVLRWIQKAEIKKKGRPKKEVEIPQELKDRLKALLMHTNTEKGRSRTHSLRRIYSLLQLDLGMAGINSLQSFYRFVNDFIKTEFGGIEGLEKCRRPAKELNRFTVAKGTIEREKGVVEVDATGYSFKGKNYSLLLCMETYSGKILSYMLMENKEKSAHHYNKAFNSLEIAKFLISLFDSYGIPKTIKTDNERVLTSEFITQGLKTLGVEIQRTRGYRPNQKLIERTIRELKDIMRTLSVNTIEELVQEAINIYNRTPHAFKHFTEPVVPNEVFPEEVFRQESYDKIRQAFREKFIRTVINNTITIENLKYEFYHPQENYELGRKKKNPTVVCFRDLENLTYLEVYSQDGTYLGRANLVSQEVPSTDTSEFKQHKQSQKRAERREKKIMEEALAIQEARIKAQEENVSDLLLFSEPSEPNQQATEEPIDILKIWTEG